MASAQPKLGSRPTVGLLVDWLEDDYQNVVLSGVADAAQDQDANLICFAGGVLRDPGLPGAQRNIIHDLAGPDNADAWVIMSGAIGNEIGPEALSCYCKRLRPLPMCSVAVALEGIPSVIVDNGKGMREMFVHLIEVHGYRRIAFIRGPLTNAEAERRYGVYWDMLAKYDLALDPDLVAVGDFQRASGAAAVRVFFDERRADIEAIVAASDHMALGAIEALRARGIGVPDEIAVVGFDDIAEARFAAPPLTTVHQPLYHQGRRAAEMVLAQLQGQAVPERVILNTEIVTRRSCGCFSRSMLRQYGDSVAASGQTFAATFAARRETILADMHRVLRQPFPDADAGWAATLLDAFFADLQRTPGGGFVVRFDEMLRRALAAGSDISAWQDVLSALRSQTLACLMHDAEERARVEGLVQELRVLIANALEGAQAQRRLQTERWARKLSATGEALMASFDLTSLVNAAAEHFPRLDIPSCYMSLYEGDPLLNGTSRLILAYDTQDKSAPRVGSELFPSRLLAPSGMFPPSRRAVFVLEPLFFGEDQLGFVLLEMGPREGLIYEALRDQISAALKGALLVEQVVEKDEERRGLLADLEKRAGELEKAYRALQENQEKLLISEKMASLGRLTASIVHEMNTPLAAVRAALADLGKLIGEYQASIGDAEVTADDHSEIAQEMRQLTVLASSAAERAALFVRGIKAQTRDLGVQERVTFNAVSCIQEAVLLLSHALRQNNCKAIFNPPADAVELFGSPVRLAQIVTNLITNAIDASIPKGGGLITLVLVQRDTGVELLVTDTGNGIAPEIMSKIFDPMFTTKPFGQGTGLGLTIVHELVTADFGGTIHASSELGVGTTFVVQFPHTRSREHGTET